MTLDDFTKYSVIFIGGFVLGCLFTVTCNTKTSSPVEKDRIDSLVVQRDSIKLKVEKLDSIKDAKVIEVISLDNDSTVKLFYELIKE